MNPFLFWAYGEWEILFSMARSTVCSHEYWGGEYEVLKLCFLCLFEMDLFIYLVCTNTMQVYRSPTESLSAEVSALGLPGFADSSQQAPSPPLELELFRQHSALSSWSKPTSPLMRKRWRENTTRASGRGGKKKITSLWLQKCGYEAKGIGGAGGVSAWQWLKAKDMQWE